MNDSQVNLKQDQPPAYESIAGTSDGSSMSSRHLNTANVQFQQPQAPKAVNSPSPAYSPNSPPNGFQVYNYMNPATGVHLTTILPPDHPEMICLQQGGHVTETRFGVLGILAAIIWFPLGVGFCLLDRKVRCKRCGINIEDGFCG